MLVTGYRVTFSCGIYSAERVLGKGMKLFRYFSEKHIDYVLIIIAYFL